MVKPSDHFNEMNMFRATVVRNEAIPQYSALAANTLNPARWTHRRLIGYIEQFESKLDEEQEIGARLVSFGSAVTFHIQDIGYYGPDIVTFSGVNDQGEAVQLIQNISQLSVLLVAMKKIGEKAKRIGFALRESVESDGEEE